MYELHSQNANCYHLEIRAYIQKEVTGWGASFDDSVEAES